MESPKMSNPKWMQTKSSVGSIQSTAMKDALTKDAKEKLKKKGIQEVSQAADKRVAAASKKVLPEITNYQNNMIKGSKTLMGGAALFIGATAVLDAGVTANRNKKARKEVERRNKKEEKSMKGDQKYRRRVRRKESMQKAHVGQTVMRMFDERTGHHKMGGSKNFPV